MIARRKLDEFDLEALAEQARRERAEAVQRLLVQPVLAFFRHAAGSNRRRQGSYRALVDALGVPARDRFPTASR